jgi:hypothetical protein
MIRNGKEIVQSILLYKYEYNSSILSQLIFIKEKNNALLVI